MEYEIKLTKKVEIRVTKAKKVMSINIIEPKRTPEQQKIRDKEIEDGLTNLWITIRQREQREQAEKLLSN